MNGGIIRSRYAVALVRFAKETGEGAQVRAQAERLSDAFFSVPGLSRALSIPGSSDSARKLELVARALGEPPCATLVRLIRLTEQHGRQEDLGLILRDFVTRYDRTLGIRPARLRIASPPAPELLEKLRALVRERTGDDARIEVTVDESLIGGFIFDIDNAVIDTTVSRQLDRIRHQFTERNRRIV